MVYICAVLMTKISIVLFYSESIPWKDCEQDEQSRSHCSRTDNDLRSATVRVFPETVSTKFRIVCFAVIAFLSAQIVSFVIAAVFECTPISLAWTIWDGQHQ